MVSTNSDDLPGPDAAVKRPRVLMLAFACEPDEGSEPEVGWKWAHTMAKSCDVRVITQSKNQARIERWYYDHPEDDRGVGFSYIELGTRWRWFKKNLPGGMYIYYTRWQWKLRSHVSGLLKSEEFDLIHHVTFASFRMPVFVTGRPVVWGPVGGAEMAPMHLLAGYGTIAGKSRERFRNITTWIASKLLKVLEPTRRTGGTALTSTPATTQLLRHRGMVPKMMPAIGYDFEDEAADTPVVLDSTPLRLLFVGRLHLLKGLHLVIKALAHLESGKVVLTIVGSGPENDRLLRLAEETGVASMVSFLGFIPRSALPAIFSRHDVVVAPSLYESGGLAVLEGFSHGLPAIVLDCGGHALSVGKDCGFKIRTNQDQKSVIDDLAAAITCYAMNRGLVGDHGATARMRLATQYSWSFKHDAMLSVYQELMGK